jgi:carbamoyl-phosphate synthase small subunit
VRRIRTTGALNGILAVGAADPEELRARARALPSMDGLNLVDGVTCAAPHRWTEGKTWGGGAKPPAGPRYHVVAYDYGAKRNILRELVSAGFEVTVVPAKTTAAEALALSPDGIFLSNGPGDPRAVDYAIRTVAELARRKPVFGICLGHQILGLALGGRVRKLRFGHHGANQPAKDLVNGRVWIASENHGFAVDMDSLAHDPDIEVTHLNLNDRTVEGLRHRRLPLFSVQYHPEACPGPHDAGYLFARFRALVEANLAPAR